MRSSVADRVLFAVFTYPGSLFDLDADLDLRVEKSCPLVPVLSYGEAKLVIRKKSNLHLFSENG